MPYLTAKYYMEKLESYKRYNCASAMLSNVEVNIDRLKDMIRLFDRVDEQDRLWTQINKPNQSTYNYSIKHKLILMYCRQLYTTQMQQDAAYLKCIALLAPGISDSLELAFDWYTKLPSDWNIIKEPQGAEVTINIGQAVKIETHGPMGFSFKK